MIVRYDHYNTARQILILAGSEAADKPHNLHPFGKGVPDYWCIQLLREVTDEFRDTGDLSQERQKAIQAAASEMGLRWNQLQKELILHW